MTSDEPPPGLQLERTTLAWQRTALAAAAAASILARIAIVQGSAVLAIVCALAAVMGGAAAVQATVGHRTRRRWFETGRPHAALPIAAPVGVAVTVVIAACGLALAVTT